MIIDRRLWLTADRSEVVEDGDPRASFLFAAPGDELSDEDVRQYKIRKTRSADKMAAPPANKAR